MYPTTGSGSSTRSGPRSVSASRSVFISYSHDEAAVAHELRDLLRARQLKVLIDIDPEDGLQPGENISAFIRRSIQSTSATLAIVSTKGLSSAWVVFEVMHTLSNEQLDSASKLIAYSTDDRFFHPPFRLEITDSVDKRVAEIDRLIDEYKAKQLTFDDINTERSRWLHMKANLGTVLDRLKNSLTLTPTPLGLPAVADRIAATLLRGISTPSNDIVERVRDIRGLIAQNQGDEAVKQLLDYGQDFFSREQNDEAVLISAEYNRVRKSEDADDLTFNDAQVLYTKIFRRILRLLDESLMQPSLPKAS
jgi:hypothetical protein